MQQPLCGSDGDGGGGGAAAAGSGSCGGVVVVTVVWWCWWWVGWLKYKSPLLVFLNLLFYYLHNC